MLLHHSLAIKEAGIRIPTSSIYIRLPSYYNLTRTAARKLVPACG